MANKLLALGSVALILLAISAVTSPADARRNGGHSFSGARSFSGGGFQARSFGGSQIRAPAYFGNAKGPVFYKGAGLYKGPGFYKGAGLYKGAGPYKGVGFYKGDKHKGHGRRFRRVLVGVPIFYGGYSYYYYGDCDWLRRRAIATGSPYWWNRYNACLYGYGYDY